VSASEYRDSDIGLGGRRHRTCAPLMNSALPHPAGDDRPPLGTPPQSFPPPLTARSWIQSASATETEETHREGAETRRRRESGRGRDAVWDHGHRPAVPRLAFLAPHASGAKPIIGGRRTWCPARSAIAVDRNYVDQKSAEQEGSGARSASPIFSSSLTRPLCRLTLSLLFAHDPQAPQDVIFVAVPDHASISDHEHPNFVISLLDVVGDANVG
jgi:hypothetical protein